MFGEAREKRKPNRAHAAATLHTTAGDYARFLIAVMSAQGLTEETIGQILTPQVKVEPDSPDDVHWGLGWGLELAGHGPGFWHWGDNGPFKAFTLSLYDEKSGVVFFANSTNGLALIEPIVWTAVGGEHPAFRSRILTNYAKLDAYDFTFVRTMQAGGLEAAIGSVREAGADAEAPLVSEGFVNALGYRLMGGERLADAIAVFQLNVELYPESSNVYDSLGEAYMENGDTDLAIANYEKSLELNPDNTNAVARLERLRTGE
jgi:tetratricopeptide (TPR) repeat protein